MGLLIEELKGAEPIVWIRTQLEGQAQEAGKAFNERKQSGQLEAGEKAPKTFRGQKAFTDASGKVTGAVVDPDNGETVVGRPAIQDMKPQSWTPPGK